MSNVRAESLSGSSRPQSACTHTTALMFLELRLLVIGCGMPGLVNAPGNGSRMPDGARLERLHTIERLWASGYRRAIDEELFHDIASRHVTLTRTVRARIRAKRNNRTQPDWG